MKRLIIALFLSCAMCGSGHGKPVDRSQIAYFPVMGKTPKEIHDNIKISAPRIGRSAVYAFTIPAVKHVKSVKTGKDFCIFSSHKTFAHYTFVLPKLVTSKGVTARVAKDWRSFVGYLKAHEEGHRAIWRKCLADYDVEALKLRARTCEALQKANEKLFNRIKLRCVEEDEKYDFYFRRDVQKQAFVKSALNP